MKKVQAKINEIMKAKRITPVDIEKATGLSRSTVYSIASGHSKNPSAHNIYLIAKTLNISLDSLLLDQSDTYQKKLSLNQMKAYQDATTSTIKVIIEKNIEFTMDKMLDLIQEVYNYSIKIDPPKKIDERFIHWIIEQNYNL